MNLKKQNISFLVVLVSMFTFTSAFAQDTLQRQKLSMHYTVGSSFTMTSGYGSGLTSWVSPTVSYPVNSRFSVHAGLTIMNTTLYGYRPYYYSVLENSPLNTKYSGNISSAMISFSGSYKVNDRLTITGSAYKQFPLYSNPSKNPYYTPDVKGMYMNVGYKILDNMYIQAGFGFQKGGVYGDYSPFGDPYFSTK
ncbi:MAG: hypothetical protein Q8867_08085 [Bacteroidota bacterium]|nr:hypothetical protein [Bacteroidota bacterium]